jgi:coatomer protein complex subunit alpha (xenin)
MTIEDEAPSGTNGFAMDEGAVDGKGFNGDLLDVEGEEDAAGWDMGDDDLNLEQVGELAVETDGAGVGMSEAELWARNSPIAADHVAAGSFETAMQLLNRQVGAVNFEPLKPRFMEIYQASKTYLPATVGLPPLVNYVRRTIEETDSRKILPAIPRDLESVRTNGLQKGFAAMKANNLEEGVKIFRGVLHNLILATVQNKSEIEEAKRIIRTATEYIIAMSIELERRDIATDESQAKRNLELSAYFTKPILELPHRQIALMSAMKLAYTKKNHVLAAHFASRVLANSSQGKNAENARKIKAVSERSGQDAIEIEYDQFAEFDICAASYTPIYSGQPFVQDPFTGAKYHPRYKGSICRVSQVTEIGAPASGLRLLAQ